MSQERENIGGEPNAEDAAEQPAENFEAGETAGEGFGIDPPIIVDGGGSVIIYSTTDLVKQAASGDYPYVYRIDVDVKWMDWHGQGHKKDKSKNGKDFRLELHDRDEA